MSEVNKENFGYLGQSFQLKVLWQLLTVAEFAEGSIPNLTAGYFDNQQHKFIMSMTKKYFEEYKSCASVVNKSIFEYIASASKSEIDKETAFGILQQIINYDKNVHAGHIPNDSEVVKAKVWSFIKQQEAKKVANEIFDNVKNGELEDKMHYIEDRFKDVIKIGEKKNGAKNVRDGVRNALKKNYRDVIPTGIQLMDHALAGGLGRGEMGMGLIPYGVGKTTLGTKFANTGFNNGKNVLQIIFEDNESDIQRKHYTLWSKIPLSELEERADEAAEKVEKFLSEYDRNKIGGRIEILKLDQDGVTMPQIRQWILNYQKTTGIIFDLLILDYLDCVESHKNVHGDTNAAELVVVKSFLSLISELNIPGWTFVQGNRTSLNAEFVGAEQMGGSIKRGQKTHFLFSVAKSAEQKMENTANMKFIKSRMTRDGQMYENAIFNNDTLEIRCIEGSAPSNKPKPQKTGANQQLENVDVMSKALANYADMTVRGKHTATVENNPPETQVDEEKTVDSGMPVNEFI